MRPTKLAALVLCAGLTQIAGSAPRRQVLVVVLDPGHGGSNTGAAGVVEGLYEKRITLAIARAVARRLQARGVEVVMTRDDDHYVTLRERVRRANASGADLLMSIHTNASPTRAQRGYE